VIPNRGGEVGDGFLELLWDKEREREREREVPFTSGLT
jgi:hypothetical protein